MAYGGERVSHSRNVHRMEDTVVRLIEAERALDREIDAFLDVKQEIRQTIALVADADCRLLLELRYPVISKEQAQWIERARKGDPKVMCEKLYGLRSDGTTTQFCTAAAWRHLINAPFKISAECCNEMKKKPLKRYTAESGRVPIIGTMAAESKLREKNWLKTGCNAYDAKRPVSTPLSFWTENDIWAYIRHYRVPYCTVYDMGYARTGCIFCMFGAHLDVEPTRFQRLQKTHPKLWRYCIRDWDAGGLGMRQVLETIGIPYENDC